MVVVALPLFLVLLFLQQLHPVHTQLRLILMVLLLVL